MKKFNVHGVFDDKRAMDAERIHHTYCIHQAAIDLSSVFQSENKYIAIIRSNVIPLFKVLIKLIMQKNHL